MKQIIQRHLAELARQIVKKHKPKVIGITGSVGKTSTRDAIYAVVSTAFSARKGNKNYNNEFGMPFAILGVNSPGRNIIKWLGVFLKAYYILWIGRLPKILVLEMGIDKTGDMDYLLSIATPDIAVVTNIGMSHYEFFKSYDAVAQEKGKIVAALPQSGVAILNADNELTLAQKNKTSAKIITYGFAGDSNVKVEIVEEKFTTPVTSTVSVRSSFLDFEVQIAGIGLPHVSSAGAAIAVGLVLNIPVEQIQAGLRNYKPVPGRLNFIQGIKQTILIDDTYNASPDSVKQALAVLARMPQQKKMVVLGDMLELGELADSSHAEIGKIVAGMNPNLLIVVGNLARGIGESAGASGLDQEKIKWFATSDEAKEYVREHLLPESVVLLKGSQGVRIEKITRELLAEPLAAEQLLTRQSAEWLK